ncbi:MAG: peptidase [Myxococcales bacterium]|nr:peptidase [Myxococcales bacterium]
MSESASQNQEKLMKRPSAPSTLRLAALTTLTTLLGACVPGPNDPAAPAAPDRSLTRALVAPNAPLRQHAEAAGGYASSVDERGVPTFIFGSTAVLPPPGSTHEAAARFHAARFAGALALGPDALALARPVRVIDRGPRGTVVHLRQRVGGVEIHGRELRLLLRQDQSLVALSGALHNAPALAPGAAFARSPDVALAGALSHALGAPVAAASVVDLHEIDGDDARYQLADGDYLLPEGALVRKVLFPEGDLLRPAFFIEFYAGRRDGESSAWRYLVAADDGTVLQRVSLTQNESFNYRVWADAKGDKRPLDGPIADWTPHPTGQADLSYPPFVPSVPIAMEGFNKNPQGKADPWLPSEATETVGNNVDAYTDRVRPEGLGGADFRAKITGPLTFAQVYDPTKIPTLNPEQAMAGITQAFYNTNWLHDYWYDSGFDEAAGNAQFDNLGRGGKSKDRMHVQTQDNYLPPAGQVESRDNANMSTPSDGLSPKMQMFVWSGRERRVLHTSPPDIDHPSATASFGPENFEISGLLAEVDDGTLPNLSDACEPIKNKSAIAGKIALIDRGTCTFKRKSINARDAGAIAVLIVNNQATAAPRMGNGDPTAEVLLIPVLSTTKAAGAVIRTAMMAGPVTARFSRKSDIDRDGGLANTVVAHEWGHYLHHRLSECNGTQQCGAMSEGWADFVAMHMIARPTDNLAGTFATAIYASVAFNDPAYFGIRRLPYSTDFRKNGLTFKHIADGEDLPTHMPRNGGAGQNSEVHDAGEVWCTMLWEVHVALQNAGRMRKPSLSFEEVRRRMADYIVTGLQMAPPEATFTETRDALMAAAGASSPEDQVVMGEAFARRGAGTCADSPPRGSATLEGVVEGFKVQPRLVVGEVTLDDSAKNCDGDGVLDAGERAKITIELSNGAALQTLEGATITLTTTTKEATFTGPTTFNIPKLGPLKSTTITTEVSLDPKMAAAGVFSLKVAPSSDAACENATRELFWKINYDLGKESTAKDDFEAPADKVWTATGKAAGVWTQIASDSKNHVRHATNLDRVSDTALESPELQVSSTDFFLIRFEHRHSFEAKDVDNVRVYYDGGLVEITDDGGVTWQDLGVFSNPGYGAKITNPSDNPLTKRKAYVDKNFGWPDRDKVTLNLIDQFAGKTVKIRFRIGTDGEGGESGWDIDNVSFHGITNTPFTGDVFDAGKCGEGPRGPMPEMGGCSISARTAPVLFALLLGAPLALLALRRRRRTA